MSFSNYSNYNIYKKSLIPIGIQGPTGPVGIQGQPGPQGPGFLDGSNNGDYLYWNSSTTSWKIGITEITLGSNAGESGQGLYAVAIGANAGNTGQGTNAVAIGANAGVTNQKQNTIVLNATGEALNTDVSNALYVKPIRKGKATNILYYDSSRGEVVYDTTLNKLLPGDGTTHSDYLYWDSSKNLWSVGSTDVHIGSGAGETNQGLNTVAIGHQAGETGQGEGSIAIGFLAGQTSQPQNSIVLNASGTALDPSGNGTLFIKPIRSAGGGVTLHWNSTTGEVTANTSTIDIKTDVGNLEDVFDSSNIYNLIPRHFRYKDTSIQNIGLISEEVDEIDSILAVKDKNGKHLGINWDGVVTYLISEIKKLEERVKILENS